ncbi:hypothetical protein M1523_03385 [Patescibacteria group bacterium]|nr:hypothetical protein [Patescibacteria group bacterium]MCL5091235.1 hypothetical protein [Patescibacteria group bacterium]
MGMIETPEQRWGRRTKPYHLTGEVNQEAYLHRLLPGEREAVQLLLQYVGIASMSLMTASSVLAVGSSTDLKSPYGDIDLLVCPDDARARHQFAERIYRLLKSNNVFTVSGQSPLGSAPISSPRYAPVKLFLFAAGAVDEQSEPRLFDMTFLGEGGGTFDDTVAFHRHHNLAFAILNVGTQ